MFECEVHGIVGTEIRTDIPLRKCNDCAERCWFQMPDCIGFLALGSGDIQECRYYSAIVGVTEGPADYRAVLRGLAMSALQPVPKRENPGIRTPDGCNSHVPPMQEDKKLDAEMYLCVVEQVLGTAYPRDNAPLRFYDDCAERCFLQMPREGKTCVGFQSRKRGGDGTAPCTFFSKVTEVRTVGANSNMVTAEYAMIASSAVPWLQKPSSPPTPPTSKSVWENYPWLAPTLGVVGVVFVAAVMAVTCLPGRKLYGPQEDVELS